MLNIINNIVFAGTPNIAAYSLQDLINAKLHISACYTQPDRPRGRNQQVTFSDVKNTAIKNNIPVFQPDTFKNCDKNLETINNLKQLNPDIIIVFAYGLILPKEILMIPKFGCFNIHTSLLPKWRGAAPIQHAILSGDNLTGISIIKMEAGLDTGDVFYTIPCPIINTDTSESLANKLQPLATTAILTVLEQLNNHQTQSTPQDHNLATYANKISKLDAKINWSLTNIQIDRMIRAFVPSPVAFTEIGTQTPTNIRIWQASVPEDTNKDKTANYPPGSILSFNKHGINVATGSGILCLEKLQFPGGKILNAIDLLNSSKYKNFFEQYTKFI